MNLNEILKECRKELRAIRIPCAGLKDITIAEANLYSKGGTCTRYFSSGKFSIKISRSLCKSGNVETVKKIIAHELIHTCPDSEKHTGNWMKYARKADRKYGYGITEQTDNAGMLHPELPVVKKYICPHCGAALVLRESGNDHICMFCGTEMTETAK